MELSFVCFILNLTLYFLCLFLQMDPIRTKIALTALTSRALISSLSVISNIVIPDHNASDVFSWTPGPFNNNYTLTIADKVINLVTDGLNKWDAQYFLHVANHGYTYENCLAFFPLFPTALRSAADVIYWLQVDYGLMHYTSALRLGGIAVNLIAFVISSILIFDLSRRVLRDDFLAYKSALFFCLNPASIFFSASYSEALHCVFTLYGLLKLEKGFSIKMSLAFGVATAVRANASINVCFILYKGKKNNHFGKKVLCF